MRKPAPSAPLPGASSGGTPRTTDAGLLAGVYGQATLSGITVLHLFDWSIKVTQTLIEVTAHGDEWEQWIPLRQGFTGRARGYLSRAADITSATKRSYLGGTNTSAGPLRLGAPGSEMTFIGYSDFGTTVLFQGLCFAEDITIEVPNAMATQEINFRGSVAPTAGIFA